MEQPAVAIEAYRQELAVMSVLLERDSQNPSGKRVVSITNELLGDAYRAAGDTSEALRQYRSSLKRMTRQQDASPNNLALQRFTAVTMRKIGQAHLEAGDKNSALEAFSESLGVAQRLVGTDPDNARWQRDLLLAYKGVADAGSDPEKNVRLALEAASTIDELGRTTPYDERVISTLRARLKELGE